MVGGDVLQRAVRLHQRERAPVVGHRLGDLVHDPAQRFDLVRADIVEQHARDVGEDALAPLRLGEPRPILPPDVRHGSGWERHGRLFATFPRPGRRADGPAVWYGARPMMAITPRIVAAHGLSQDEYARIRKVLGRDPNIVELGVFSAMWSEHCSYKSSRRLLRHLPTKGPRVLQGPGENAGVIDVGGGLAVAFKMESHNHPSYIEPYQGAATASTAPPWRALSSTRRARASARRCKSGTRSWRSSCSRPAWSCSRRTAWSGSRTWARRGSPHRRSRWPRARAAGSSWTSTRSRAGRRA